MGDQAFVDHSSLGPQRQIAAAAYQHFACPHLESTRMAPTGRLSQYSRRSHHPYGQGHHAYFRPPTEGWLDRHLRAWKSATHSCMGLSSRCDHRSLCGVCCSPVGGPSRLLGGARILRYRSVADRAAMRHYLGSLRQWSRRRLGRRRLRWEEPQPKLAGESWWWGGCLLMKWLATSIWCSGLVVHRPTHRYRRARPARRPESA